MSTSISQYSHVAIIGNPNCGKTTIFNELTGLRQKVGNYPGVTVEKKEGSILLSDGKIVTILDLPGRTACLLTLPMKKSPPIFF